MGGACGERRHPLHCGTEGTARPTPIIARTCTPPTAASGRFMRRTWSLPGIDGATTAPRPYSLTMQSPQGRGPLNRRRPDSRRPMDPIHQACWRPSSVRVSGWYTRLMKSSICRLRIQVWSGVLGSSGQGGSGDSHQHRLMEGWSVVHHVMRRPSQLLVTGSSF